MSKICVDTNTGCWEFIGSRKSRYSYFYLYGEKITAHRLTYFLFNFHLDDNLSIDHLCRNTHCVNPNHLEQVTHRENVLRGIGPTAINYKKTHCKRGHQLVGDNVRIHKKQFGRECITCKQEYDFEYNIKHSEKKKKSAKEWASKNKDRVREIKRKSAEKIRLAKMLAVT